MLIHYVASAYLRIVLLGLYRIARVGLVTPVRKSMLLDLLALTSRL